MAFLIEIFPDMSALNWVLFIFTLIVDPVGTLDAITGVKGLAILFVIFVIVIFYGFWRIFRRESEGEDVDGVVGYD